MQRAPESEEKSKRRERKPMWSAGSTREREGGETRCLGVGGRVEKRGGREHTSARTKSGPVRKVLALPLPLPRLLSIFVHRPPPIFSLCSTSFTRAP